MLETPVEQECKRCNHFFSTTTPRQCAVENLKVWRREERRRLVREGLSGPQINKTVRTFEKEERKRRRCPPCNQIVDAKHRKDDKEKRDRKKAEKELERAKERRIASIEEKLNYICEKFKENKTLPDLNKVEILSQINEIKQALQPDKVRKGQKKEEWKELWDLKKNYTEKGRDIPLTKKQEDKIWGVKSIDGLRRIVEDIEKIHGEIQYLKEHSIYSLKTWKHQVGWPLFLILAPVTCQKN
jgi:hypothetical protein